MLKLEAENLQMQEQFNVQRAKMKELFLQKEGLCQYIFCGEFEIIDSVLLFFVSINLEQRVQNDSCKLLVSG